MQNLTDNYNRQENPNNLITPYMESNEALNRQKQPQSEPGMYFELSRKSINGGISQSTTDKLLNYVESVAKWIGENPVKTICIIAGANAPFIIRDCFVAYHTGKNRSKKK